jgi:hypothetical protein
VAAVGDWRIVLVAAVLGGVLAGPAVAYGVADTSHEGFDRLSTVGTYLPETSLGSTEYYASEPMWVAAPSPMVSPMLPGGFAMPAKGFDSDVHGQLAGCPPQASYLTVSIPSSADATNGARVYVCLYQRERVPSDGGISGDAMMSNGTGAGQNVVEYYVNGSAKGGITLGGAYPTKDSALHTMSWDNIYHGLGFGGDAAWSIDGFYATGLPTFKTSPEVYSEDETWGWQGESVYYIVVDEVFPNVMGGTTYEGTWTHRVYLGYGRNDRGPSLLTANQEVRLLKEETASAPDEYVAPSWPASSVSWADVPGAPALVHGSVSNAGQSWWDVPHLMGGSYSWPVFNSPASTSADSWESVFLTPEVGDVEYTGALGCAAWYGVDAMEIVNSHPESHSVGGGQSSGDVGAKPPTPGAAGHVPTSTVPPPSSLLPTSGTDTSMTILPGWVWNGIWGWFQSDVVGPLTGGLEAPMYKIFGFVGSIADTSGVGQ